MPRSTRLLIAAIVTMTAAFTQAPAEELPADMLNRVRDKTFRAAMAAKTDPEKLTAISQLNALARYGDMPARWALVRNYHQARVVRKVVSPEDAVRYGLDVLASKPEGVEKADFEFIFVLSKLYEEGNRRVFGLTLVDAMRDDPRLRDPALLGEILQRAAFAPGACDGVLEAARIGGFAGKGEEGCSDEVRDFLIEHTAKRGPLGKPEAEREAVSADLKAMDADDAQ